MKRFKNSNVIQCYCDQLFYSEKSFQDHLEEEPICKCFYYIEKIKALPYSPPTAIEISLYSKLRFFALTEKNALEKLKKYIYKN